MSHTNRRSRLLVSRVVGLDLVTVFDVLNSRYLAKEASQEVCRRAPGPGEARRRGDLIGLPHREKQIIDLRVIARAGENFHACAMRNTSFFV